MNALLGLLLIVGSVSVAVRVPATARLLRWLPMPLWCYVLPMAAVAGGWLPAGDPWYRHLTTVWLPVALAILLLGVSLSDVRRVGGPALAAMAIGASSIILGAPCVAWLLRRHLPSEAWTGIGALAGTWTGGSMNLLALRTVLGTPDEIFTALILVDAVVAYGWMTVLAAVSSRAAAINRWLRAKSVAVRVSQTADVALPSFGRRAAGVVIGAGIAGLSLWVSAWCPTTGVISSWQGWAVLLATTVSLAASGLAAIRRAGEAAAPVGTFGLYLVLAAMGAQARLDALWSAPAWLLVGAGVAMLHGGAMLLGGRWLRIPLGVLATASQANFGGVVSAPVVAGMYDRALMPIGLCLAVTGNALGTYAGLLSAGLARFLCA